MGEAGEPVDGTASPGPGTDDEAAGHGEVGNGDGQGGAPSAPVGEATTGTTAARASRLRSPRVLLGLGAATVAIIVVVVVVVVVVGGVAVGSGSGDDESSSPEEATSATSVSPTTAAETTTTSRAPSTSTTTMTTTTTTLAPTTGPPGEPAGASTSEPAADDGVMTSTTVPSHTVPVCGLGPWGRSNPQGTVPGPPDKARLVNGPVWNCANGTTGCNVSISTAWSDGVTASDSRVLTAPGPHTLNDGRGTTANFSVSSALYCGFDGANYSNFWPPGT